MKKSERIKSGNEISDLLVMDPKFSGCVSLVMLNGIMLYELSEILTGKHVSMYSGDSLQTLYHGLAEGLYEGTAENNLDQWIMNPDDGELKACRACLGGMQQCFDYMQEKLYAVFPSYAETCMKVKKKEHLNKNELADAISDVSTCMMDAYVDYCLDDEEDKNIWEAMLLVMAALGASLELCLRKIPLYTAEGIDRMLEEERQALSEMVNTFAEAVEKGRLNPD